MKITKSYLKQVIKEELGRLNEEVDLSEKEQYQNIAKYVQELNNILASYDYEPGTVALKYRLPPMPDNTTEDGLDRYDREMQNYVNNFDLDPEEYPQDTAKIQQLLKMIEQSALELVTKLRRV